MIANRRSLIHAATAALAASLCVWSAAAMAQAPAPAPQGRGGGGFAADPRVDQRTYHFAEAGQELPYCVYKSTKVAPDKPAPLVVALHGMGAPPSIMCNKTSVDLAEAGGYILVAPMGFNTTGWYGSPVINMGAGRGPGPGRGNGATAPGAAPGPGAGAPAAGPGNAAPRGGPATESAPAIDPAQLAKWSEQDVMNVLDMMRKEFKVDPKRIYLTGHSMGGAGTFFLGAKHADLWAAIAPVAPASFMMNGNRAELLGKIKAAGIPVLLITGDADEAVPVANTRMWAETLKELGVLHEYVEQPGVTHGPIITSSQEAVFAFFDKHRKK